jgi:hypothetical protein
MHHIEPKRQDSTELKEKLLEENINKMLERILRDDDEESDNESTLSLSSGSPNGRSQHSFSKRPSNLKLEEVLERIKSKQKILSEDYEIISGHICNILKTQNGSRILQTSLCKTNPEIISSIFYELKFHLFEMIIDPYGNYFIPKFYSLLSNDNKLFFLMEIQQKIKEIGISKIGTYPLQNIIGNLKSQYELNILTAAVTNSLLELCQDPQGVHVVEKLMITYEGELIFPIYEMICDNLYLISTNINGLCVAKKIIIQNKNEFIKMKVRAAICRESVDLIQHIYGNYVVQTALEHWDHEFLLPLMEKFYGNFAFLSIQKYSSNVLEKCFEKMKYLIVVKFIEETSRNAKVVELMKHAYGNYVIQKALKIATGQIKNSYIDLIFKNINKLNDRKLIAKWTTILQNSRDNLNVQSLYNINMNGCSTESNRNNNQFKISSTITNAFSFNSNGCLFSMAH